MLRRGPLAADEEGGDVAHDEAQGVEDDPGDDDALQPGPGFIHRQTGAGEVHPEAPYILWMCNPREQSLGPIVRGSADVPKR